MSFPSIVAPSKVRFPLAELRVAETVEISLIVKLPPFCAIVPFPKLSPLFRTIEPLLMVKSPFIVALTADDIASLELFKIAFVKFKFPPVEFKLTSPVETPSKLKLPFVCLIVPFSKLSD